MDGLEIVYRLKRQGLCQADIARTLGVSASVVGNVIHDRITSFGVASHVAALLGNAPITQVFANGQAAAALYRRWCQPLTGVPAIALPWLAACPGRPSNW